LNTQWPTVAHNKRFGPASQAAHARLPSPSCSLRGTFSHRAIILDPLTAPPAWVAGWRHRGVLRTAVRKSADFRCGPLAWSSATDPQPPTVGGPPRSHLGFSGLAPLAGSAGRGSGAAGAHRRCRHNPQTFRACVLDRCRAEPSHLCGARHSAHATRAPCSPC